ncbi:MAG: type II secretion system protein GspD [Selenomonadaceae bacterium]|nr:type II secretion system protein GspD [Selenomonadaceae bacterium]
MNLKKFLPLLVSAIFFMPAQIQAAPMTLSVHEADLRSTIMLVAKNGGLNVSVDDSVKGTISISVENVEPLRLLEIISRTKSLQLIQEAGVYIMTASSVEVMQSYVFPIRYGDAETLRDAVIMSLDPDTERLPNSTTRIRNADGSYTYRYTYRNDDSDDYNDFDNVKRKDRVYINPEVNALVLYGTPAEYERVKNLLATLDVELKQVSVEAKILAITKEEAKNLGVEWTWASIDGTYSAQRERTRSSESASGYSNQSSRSLSEQLSDTNIFSNSSLIQFGRSLTSVTGLNWALSAQINALVTDGKAKILSRPNVMTIQGREAVINVGSSVPVPKISSTNTATTTEIEYRDAGIILRYTPRINADGTITAKIHTEVSTPQYVADMGAYRFNTRSAETTVTVRDGEPMVIGGLIGAEEEKSVSKIPFLGDLPLLGALFRNHRKSKSESELIIFLTAHVLGGNSNEILSIKP